MKTPLLCLATLLVSCVSLSAQAPEPRIVPSTAISARDGFTVGGTAVLFTRNGVTQKVEKEVVLENGLRVGPEGTATLPNGEKIALHNNQILTLHGALEDVALTPQGIAPVTSAGSPVKKAGEGAVVTTTDGITFSGTEAVLTRNGVSQRLTKEMRLRNGAIVEPNGLVTLPNRAPLTIRADQVLGFDGVLRGTLARPSRDPVAATR